MVARRGVSGKSRNYQHRSGEDARRAKSAGKRTAGYNKGPGYDRMYNWEKATSFETSRRYNGNHPGKPRDY